MQLISECMKIEALCHKSSRMLEEQSLYDNSVDHFNKSNEQVIFIYIFMSMPSIIVISLGLMGKISRRFYHYYDQQHVKKLKACQNPAFGVYTYRHFTSAYVLSLGEGQI